MSLEEKRLKFLGTPHNVTVVQGDETVLDCAATGVPTPSVTWKKLTGNPRVFDTSPGISNLEFVNVSENDGGEFKCQASSGGITISKIVWLIVRGMKTNESLKICVCVLIQYTNAAHFFFLFSSTHNEILLRKDFKFK